MVLRKEKVTVTAADTVGRVPLAVGVVVAGDRALKGEVTSLEALLIAVVPPTRRNGPAIPGVGKAGTRAVTAIRIVTPLTLGVGDTGGVGGVAVRAPVGADHGIGLPLTHRGVGALLAVQD